MIQPLILYGIIVIILFLDLILYKRGGYKSTITKWILDNPNRAGIFGFLMGCLFGHLFL